VISFVVRVRQKFLFDRYVMSPDVYGGGHCPNRQLGIFIKKNSRFNRYVTKSSMRDLNASKATRFQNIFSSAIELVRHHPTSFRAIQNNRLKIVLDWII
jgi:hypothetical protein